MLTVLKADCDRNEVGLGFEAIGRMLSHSHDDQSKFEQAFPSLNGGCNLYPRLAGFYRDLEEPTSIYLSIESGSENDCVAIAAIPGIASCRVLPEPPDCITDNWVSVGPFENSNFRWSPEEGGD
jgi:hypothetical protein